MSPVTSPSGPARRLTVVLAIAATLAIGACSGSAASPSRAPATATPSGPTASVNLVAEIDAVIAGINEAATKYGAGDKQGALDAIATTYEEHFELVEDPLGDVDEEFKESLEKLISVDIRAAINEGKPAADVAALVATAVAELVKAKGMLQ